MSARPAGPGPRPAIHLTAAGWVNDPLALTWHRGRYHVFYQYLPHRTSWAPECQWGHAVSADLVSWTARPAALAPGDGDAGCWSGCLVPGSGTGPGARPPVIFYTSVPEHGSDLGRIRTARPAGTGWDAWVKSPAALRLPVPAAAAAFRDPFVWAGRAGWRLLAGAGLDGGTGAVLGYSSPDLRSWNPEGVVARAAAAGPSAAGPVFECPQLALVRGQAALIVSVGGGQQPGGTIYATGPAVGSAAGRADDSAGPAAPDWRQLTFGRYYAACFFTDADGRPGLVHWIRGAGPGPGQGGWAGALSLPHALDLRDGRLILSPHPSLARLGRPADLVRRWPGGRRRLGVTGPCDLSLRLDRITAPVSVRILPAGGGEPVAAVTLDRGQVRSETAAGPAAMPLGCGARLRLVADHGLVEVFAPGGTALAAAFAPPGGGFAVEVEGRDGGGLAGLRAAGLGPPAMMAAARA